MSAQGSDRSDGDRDVLSNLPHSRPHRRSAKRQGSAASARKAPAGAGAKPAQAKPKTARAAAPKAAAKPAPKPAPAATTRSEAAQRLRKPPKPPAPLPPRAGQTQPPKGEPTPGGTELIGTVVQAAGELAQVGLTIGGQVVKRALSRLPKP